MGGGCYDRLQNIICTIALFLVLVINIFAEVPHTTIVENPSKEVTKVETLKRRDKAELNITVEKKKSKEVIGYVDGNKVIISKEKNPQVNFEDSYEVIDNLDGKISKGYTITTTEEGIEIEGSKVPNFLYLLGKNNVLKLFFDNNENKIYKIGVDGNIGFLVIPLKNNDSRIQILDKNNNELIVDNLIFDENGQKYIQFLIPRNLINNLKVKITTLKKIHIYNTKINIINNKNFKKSIRNLNREIYDEMHEFHGGEYWNIKEWISGEFNGKLSNRIDINIKVVSRGREYASHDGWGFSEGGHIYIDLYDENDNFLKTEHVQLWGWASGDSRPSTEGDYNYPFYKVPDSYSFYYEKPVKYKVRYSFFTAGFSAHDPNGSGLHLHISVITNVDIIVKSKLDVLKGQSTLQVREKYPTNQYIQFNSTKFEEGKPLALENSLTDVTFNTTGKGIVTMQEGDILEIDGKQVTIGAGGNLGVQEATIGDLKYSYKVEAGKLRLALNEWGVLEPNHDLMIRVFRTENGNQRKMVEHTLTIDSPRRVEGTNNIKVDNSYQIRNVIKFNGISLDTPSSFALESPIPAGITLAEQTGYGIPLLDEGDILQIDDGRTRTVHSYTIQSGGSLPSQRVEFTNGSIDLQVVNRKVQVRLNNWKVNEPMRLNLRAIRGVNEISNHEITLTAPEAPFNMLETGNLDFGNVLQGAKNKKAESNIRIEMLAGQDVSEVKFNLREEQPVMTNSQGTELKVKSIDKTVQKVRDREYNIKLRGTLDVPEEQKNGEYRGSNILDIEVK